MQNRNMMVFVLLAVGLFLGWDALMRRLYPPQPKPASAPPAAEAKEAKAAKPSPAAAAPLAPAPALLASPARPSLRAEATVKVETKAYRAELSTRGGRFRSLLLKGYTHKSKTKEEPLDLILAGEEPLYGAVEIQGADLVHTDWALETPQPLRSADGWQTVRFSAAVAGLPLRVRKSFSFDPEKPGFRARLELHNSGAAALPLRGLALLWGPNLGGVDEVGGIMFPPSGVVQLEGKIARESADDDIETFRYGSPRWAALKNHYFVTGFFPAEGQAWDFAEVRCLGKARAAVALGASSLSLEAGRSAVLEASAYAGPQEYDVLKAVGHNFHRVVQFQFYQIFDWLNPLCVLLLHILKWFQKVSGNWGVAIILLTLLVRGLLFYPSQKSMVSMRKMQTKMAAMQPRLDTIKKMYKDDPSRLNTEMMKLYKEYGVNPLGGCLPMLLQIPIFFALYGTLQAAFELRQADFLWKWNDLTAGDPTFIFPLLMGASMYFQQKLTPTSATMSDEQAQMQKMMMYMMPVMFTGMSIFMAWPVGLLLYWTASNAFGIAQQLVVNKTVN